jgi:hypothetical protein
MREGLSAPQSSIRGVNGAGARENRSIAFQKHKTCLLIGKPTQGGDGNHSIRSNDDKPFQAMPDSWEATITA